MATSFIIVGLGNPGEEYETTRHNTGRILLDAWRKKHDFPDWEKDKTLNALVSKGKVGKQLVTLCLPETMMNNSGKSVKLLCKTPKEAKNLVVVYDDLDLPLGSLRVSFNRGSGGHHGVESIIKALKTREFARLRVGISKVTSAGKSKKVSAEKVVDFILGKFSPAELAGLKKVTSKVVTGLDTILEKGVELAMNEINSSF